MNAKVPLNALDDDVEEEEDEEDGEEEMDEADEADEADLEDEDEEDPEEHEDQEDDEMETIEAEDDPVELPAVLGDEGELIDLIIDQSVGKHRVYTDITVTPENMYNTYPYLTKYEMARIIGVRAEQLGRNAPPLIKAPADASDYEIARLEIIQGRCPWMIARPLPNGMRLLINVNLLKLL